jgi:hypothetical protein
MTHKSLHLPTTPPAVLADSVICTKQLLITEQSAAIAVDESGSSLEFSIRRSTQMTATLRKFEGYSHHGINE